MDQIYESDPHHSLLVDQMRIEIIDSICDLAIHRSLRCLQSQQKMQDNSTAMKMNQRQNSQMLQAALHPYTNSEQNLSSARSGRKEAAVSPHISIEELYMIKQVTGKVDSLIIYDSNNYDEAFEKITEIKTSKEISLSDEFYDSQIEIEKNKDQTVKIFSLENRIVVDLNIGNSVLTNSSSMHGKLRFVFSSKASMDTVQVGAQSMAKLQSTLNLLTSMYISQKEQGKIQDNAVCNMTSLLNLSGMATLPQVFYHPENPLVENNSNPFSKIMINTNKQFFECRKEISRYVKSVENQIQSEIVKRDRQRQSSRRSSHSKESQPKKASNEVQIWFYNFVDGVVFKVDSLQDGLEGGGGITTIKIDQIQTEVKPFITKCVEQKKVSFFQNSEYHPVTSMFGNSIGYLVCPQKPYISQLISRSLSQLSQIIELTLLKLHTVDQLQSMKDSATLEELGSLNQSYSSSFSNAYVSNRIVQKLRSSLIETPQQIPYASGKSSNTSDISLELVQINMKAPAEPQNSSNKALTAINESENEQSFVNMAQLTNGNLQGLGAKSLVENQTIVSNEDNQQSLKDTQKTSQSHQKVKINSKIPSQTFQYEKGTLKPSPARKTWANNTQSAKRLASKADFSASQIESRNKSNDRIYFKAGQDVKNITSADIITFPKRLEYSDHRMNSIGQILSSNSKQSDSFYKNNSPARKIRSSRKQRKNQGQQQSKSFDRESSNYGNSNPYNMNVSANFGVLRNSQETAGAPNTGRSLQNFNSKNSGSNLSNTQFDVIKSTLNQIKEDTNNRVEEVALEQKQQEVKQQVLGTPFAEIDLQSEDPKSFGGSERNQFKINAHSDKNSAYKDNNNESFSQIGVVNTLNHQTNNTLDPKMLQNLIRMTYIGIKQKQNGSIFQETKGGYSHRYVNTVNAGYNETHGDQINLLSERNLTQVNQTPRSNRFHEKMQTNQLQTEDQDMFSSAAIFSERHQVGNLNDQKSIKQLMAEKKQVYFGNAKDENNRKEIFIDDSTIKKPAQVSHPKIPRLNVGQAVNSYNIKQNLNMPQREQSQETVSRGGQFQLEMSGAINLLDIDLNGELNNDQLQNGSSSAQRLGDGLQYRISSVNQSQPRHKTNPMQMVSNRTHKKLGNDSDSARIYQEFSQMEESVSASHNGLGKIPDNASKNQQTANKSMEKDPQKFDDSLDQFVQILKKTTQASDINIYSKDLTQIYTDHSAITSLLNEELKDDVDEKLQLFKQEIIQKENEQIEFQQSVVDKTLKYKIPSFTHFKQFKSYEQSDYDSGMIKQTSGLRGIDFLMTKISLDNENEVDSQQPSQNYLIFLCTFRVTYIQYFPEMFINICQNFLLADEQLKSDFKVLLQITEQAQLFFAMDQEQIQKINQQQQNMDVSVDTTPQMASGTLQTEEDMIEDEGDINGKTSNGLIVSSGFGAIGRQNTAKSSLEIVSVNQVQENSRLSWPKNSPISKERMELAQKLAQQDPYVDHKPSGFDNSKISLGSSRGGQIDQKIKAYQMQKGTSPNHGLKQKNMSKNQQFLRPELRGNYQNRMNEILKKSGPTTVQDPYIEIAESPYTKKRVKSISYGGPSPASFKKSLRSSAGNSQRSSQARKSTEKLGSLLKKGQIPQKRPLHQQSSNYLMKTPQLDFGLYTAKSKQQIPQKKNGIKPQNSKQPIDPNPMTFSFGETNQRVVNITSQQHQNYKNDSQFLAMQVDESLQSNSPYNGNQRRQLSNK